MLDLLSRLPRRLLLLKALSKKEILVPAYTRSDGTYVPAHYKHVNFNADVGAVLSGKSSPSHKEALKKLSKVKGFKELPAEHQHAHVLSSAQNIQTNASKLADVGRFRKALLAGQKPKPGLIASFKWYQQKDPAKAAAILDELVGAVGMDKFIDLVGPTALALEEQKKAAAGPTEEEKAIAKDKLALIAGKAKGTHYPYLAWKKLSGDVKVWGSFKNPVEKLQAVVDLAKKMQDEATFGSAVSNLTKKLAEGKVPSPGELKAYQALDDNAKLKAAQTAIKKSGGKQTFGSLAELMKQAEAKAGITVDKPEKVSLKDLAAETAQNFGHQHEGEVVGVPGAQAKFKFDNGKWTYWTGDDWNQVKSAEWLALLDKGQTPFKQQMEVVSDPVTSVPEPDDGQWSYNDYDEAFSGCPSLVFSDHYVVYDGAQFEVGELGTDTPKHYSAPQRVQSYLQSKGIHPPSLTTLEQMQATAEAGPSEDDSAWSFDPADPGFSGEATLTMTGPDGKYHFVVYSPQDDHFQVGTMDDSFGEPQFETYSFASEVVDHLKQQGLHPPSVSTLIDKLVGADTGPQEGDTKQGVGGLLTLKDGHWTLNNAAMVSFFNEHAIKPGSATAIAVTMAVAYISEGKDPSAVMAQLVSVKEAAKHQGYAPAQINDIITALNSVHSEVLDYNDPFGPKPSGVAEADAAGFEPDVNTPPSGASYEHLLHNTTEGHNKFWKVTVDPVAKTATTTWGKIGTKGQSQTYKHATAQAALDAAKKAAQMKADKGYKTHLLEDGIKTAPAAPPPANFGPSNKDKVFQSTTPTGSVGLFKYTGGAGSGWEYSVNLGKKWMPVQPKSVLAKMLAQGKDAYGAALQPGAERKHKSFGEKHEGKVFSSTMSTGAIGFYKYEGGQWLFSFDPDTGEWDPIPSVSQLHDNLEQGKASGGQPLELSTHYNEPKWSFEPGQVFEAGVSANSSKKMTFKYAGDGKWEHPFGDGWTPVTTSAWLTALNSGKGLDGKPIAEVESPDGADEAVPSGFGAANPGKVFVAKAPGGAFQVLFKYDGSGMYWNMSTDDGLTWQPVQVGTVLSEQLDTGTDGSGKPLQLYEGGPKEGDMKPGANGWLILKDGHWVKVSLDEALAQLCPVPETIQSTFFKQALNGVVHGAAQWKKVATTKMGMPNITLTINGFGKFVGRAKKDDLGKWVPASAALSAKNIADALNFLEHVGTVKAAFEKNKKIPDALPGAPAPVAAPAAPKPVPAAPAASGVPDSIDGWKKVGEQGGFNPGGTYKDPDGVEWYCKFPAGGAKVARNELLANKLYAAAGLAVPEVKLVTQNGKIGLASKIVTNAKQDKAALQGGKGEGLLSGFVADAWLANWDVVGNNPAAGKGWDNILFKQGIAYRIDPGGALLYGGAGGKKAAFGNQVIELDTMRDANINARTAKVFGGISDADLKASAAKVLAISDAQIEQMVKQFGPGDELEKAALAKTLKARKADIAAKFPSVAAKIAKEQVNTPTAKKITLPPPKKLDPTDTSWVKLKPGEQIVESGEKYGVLFVKIKVPPSGFNAAGIPKPPEYTYSTSPHVNAANTADLKRIYDLALAGATPDEIKNMTFEEILKETGEKTGKLLTVEQHPSTKYLLEYHSQVMAEVKAQLEPTFRTEQHGSFTESYSAVAKAIAEQLPTLAHQQFKTWKDKAADYLVLDRSVGESIPMPDKGHFKDVETLSSPLIKDWVEQSKSAFAKLSASEQKAVRDYTGNSVYHQWNTAMRLGETESSAWKSSKPMRDAFDHGATELPAGIIIHRGINVGNQTYKSVVGAVIQDGSFQSTSYGTKAAFSSSTSQLRLHITSGVKGMLVSHTSKSGAGEREIILDRNCRYLVMGVEGKHIDILVLPHEE
jgi:predicted DNA-binding WGR domain protein